MISVPEADNRIRQNCPIFPAIKVLLQECCGRVLRENIYADRDHQPADMVQMDGIAIAFDAWKKGRWAFDVAGIQKAGQPALSLKSSSNCLEVVTGALLPKSCDCVIPIEDVILKNGKAVLKKGARLQRNQFIRSRGDNYCKEDLLVRAGEILTPPKISVAAAVGKSKLLVNAIPKIAVIAIGDELVDIDRKGVLPHQFRRSNVYVLDALLKLCGFTRNKRLYLPDHPAKIKAILAKSLGRFDIVILSGAVSMGKFDYVPDILKSLKADILFHKIKERPGKPLLFARHKNTVIFGLPGNPVSTLVCACRYVLPFLKQSAGQAHPAKDFAVLNGKFKTAEALTYFVPVALTCTKTGRVHARMLPFTGSGDYLAFSHADGFIELPFRKSTYKTGETARLFRFNPL